MDNKHYVDPNVDSGRFSEPEELEADYTEVSYDCSDNPKQNTAAGVGIEVRCDANGEVTGALVDGGDTNTIIVSSTGAGKTRRILSHYILSCIYAMQSFIVHDPKGEIYGFFYKLLKKMGFKVKVLNLRDPMKGDRLNFLQEAAKLWKKGNRGRALEVARGIAQTLYSPLEDKDDKFWTQSSVNLFLCYFTIAATIYEPEYVTLETIYRIHIEGIEKVCGTMRIQAYLDEHKEEKCYELGIPSVTAPNETRTSIYSIFTNGLVRVLLNEEIADMTTKSTFRIEEMVSGKRPLALFIITRDEAPQTYSTVVSSIVDMIYTTLIDLAHTKYDKRLPRTVHLILEEFGNIAKLENINDMMTASRSRSIRIVVVLQSLCQLYLTYSKELAEVLIGNSQNLVYMSSTDMNLVGMISKRCGTMIDQYTYERRPLLSPDRLTHLDKNTGETLMLLDRHYPYITSLPDLSCYKMIEPLERFNIPTRKKIEVETGRFAKLVDEMFENRLRMMMEPSKPDPREKKAEMSRKKAVALPSPFLAEMEKIIKEA